MSSTKKNVLFFVVSSLSSWTKSYRMPLTTFDIRRYIVSLCTAFKVLCIYSGAESKFPSTYYLKFCFIIEYSTLRNDCWHSLLFPHNKTKAPLTLHRIPCCKHLNIFFIYLFFSCTRIEKEVKFIFMSQRVTVLHTQTHTKEFLFATKVAFYIAFVTNLKTNDF